MNYDVDDFLNPEVASLPSGVCWPTLRRYLVRLILMFNVSPTVIVVDDNFSWRYVEASPFSAQFPKDLPQDSEFALRVSEEWAVSQGRGIKEKQNWDESKTKSRLCNRTPVSFLVLEMVAVYLLVALPIGLDRGG